MKSRFPLLLAALVLVSACATEPPTPPLTTPTGRPEIIIHAPIDRVRSAIITQQAGEGATLASQSENRLTFATQSSNVATNVLYGTPLSGNPYIRATYTLAAEARNTHVFLGSEIISNYGTAFEKGQPMDSPALRQAQQRNLLKVQVIAETK